MASSSGRRLRALPYARVSTGDREAGAEGQPPQRRKQDPEGQLLKLREYCAQRGWPIVAEEADVITSDPARRRRDPPGLVRQLRRIVEGKGDVLVIVGADRLVAGPVALLNLVARIQELGGAIASLEDGRDLDTTDDMSALSLFMKGLFNKWRLKLGRAATVRGIARARAAGKRIGRPPAAAPTPEQIAEVEAAAGHALGHRALAAYFGTSPWAIRCVRNPGLKKPIRSDEEPPADSDV